MQKASRWIPPYWAEKKENHETFAAQESPPGAATGTF
jgi:hypothetical protein